MGRTTRFQHGGCIYLAPSSLVKDRLVSKKEASNPSFSVFVMAFAVTRPGYYTMSLIFVKYFEDFNFQCFISGLLGGG